MVEELREIRKLLTPAQKPPPLDGLVDEFVDFISQYKVLGLAVAFILAIHIGNVVSALVNSFIMPLVQIVFPAIGGTGEAAVEYVLAFGPILDSFITFIVVAFVVFIIVKIAARIGIE